MHSALQGVQGPGGGSFSDQDVCGSKQAHNNAKLQSPKASKFISFLISQIIWQHMATMSQKHDHEPRNPWESLTCPRKAPSISAPEGIKETQFCATETCHQLSAIGRYTSISCSWITCSKRESRKITKWNVMGLHGTTVVSYIILNNTSWSLSVWNCCICCFLPCGEPSQNIYNITPPGHSRPFFFTCFRNVSHMFAGCWSA